MAILAPPAPPALSPAGAGPRLERRASASVRDDEHPCVPAGLCLTVAVLGASGEQGGGIDRGCGGFRRRAAGAHAPHPPSGDLAKKKTFPALFTLFNKG